MPERLSAWTHNDDEWREYVQRVASAAPPRAFASGCSMNAPHSFCFEWRHPSSGASLFALHAAGAVRA